MRGTRRKTLYLSTNDLQNLSCLRKAGLNLGQLAKLNKIQVWPLIEISTSELPGSAKVDSARLPY